MAAYYNENDPYAAAWLRNLIGAWLVPDGEVDERSIKDVQPEDLNGFDQCHWFAGIGGWALAGRMAGWPDERELWTCSCPCQPFSVAGKQAGTGDARHLWPDYFRIHRARRPAVVFGEQVAQAAGGDWLDGVLADLEGEGYAWWAGIVPACAVNAPHERQRLWWCGVDRWGRGLVHGAGERRGEGRPEPEFRRGRDALHGADPSGGDMGHGHGQGRPVGQGECGDACPQRAPAERADRGCCRCGEPVADSGGIGLQWREGAAGGSLADRRGAGLFEKDGRADNGAEIDRRNFWHGARWIDCHDGKRRRVPGPEKRSESGIRLLVDGVSGRMDALRAYGGGGEGSAGRTGGADRRISRSAAWRPLGNAIVPQVAAELIRAFLDCQP